MIDMKGLNQVDNINDVDLKEKLLNEDHIGFRIYQTCDVYSEPTDPTETPELLYPAGWYEVQNNEDETAQEFILIEGASNLEEVEVDKTEGVNGYVHRYGNHIEFYFTASSDVEIKDIVNSMPKPKTASEFVATCSTTNPSSTDIVKLDGLGKLSFLTEGHKDFVVKGSYFSIDYDPAQGWAIDHKVEEIKVGDIRVFANCSGQAVDGWLECNGGEVSKTTYADLYVVVQDRFEDPDNPCQAGNFRLPNIDDLDTKMPSFIRWKVTEVNTQGVVALRDLADVDGANLQDGTPLCWNAERSRWETMPGESVIIGDVRAFAFNACPDGWLPCSGDPYDKDEYPDLFKVIGSSFGTYSGTDTSKTGWPLLPDLNSGRFIEGGTGVGATGYKDAGLPNITGTITTNSQTLAALRGNTYTVTGAFKESPTGSGSQSGYSSYSTGTANVDFKASNSNPIYGNSDTVQPKSAQMFYCIRAVATHAEGEVKVISTYECVDISSSMGFNSTYLGNACAYQVGNVVYVMMQVKTTTTDKIELASSIPKVANVNALITYGAHNPMCFGNITLDTSTVGFVSITNPSGTNTPTKLWAKWSGTSGVCNFSYITDSYTPALPIYDHSPVDGETLVYDGANSRWKLGPATTYSVQEFSINDIVDSSYDIEITFNSLSRAYQWGRMMHVIVIGDWKPTAQVPISGRPVFYLKSEFRPNGVNSRFEVSSGSLGIIGGFASSNGYVDLYDPTKTIDVPSTTYPVRFEMTYFINTNTPALPAFSRTPQDGDILQFDGTDNKWDLHHLDSEVHFNNTAITGATRAQLFTDAYSNAKGSAIYSNVKFASAEVPRYQSTGNAQSVYVNISTPNWGTMMAISQTDQRISFCRISSGVISDWKELAMETINDGVQTLDNRQALYNLAYTTNKRLDWSFYGSFNTASENPNGQAAGGSARFTFHIYIVNAGEFARIVAYDRSTTDIYTCRGEALNSSSPRWGNWVKMVDEEDMTLVPGTGVSSGRLYGHRVGNELHIYGYFTVSSTIARNSIIFSLPSGWKFDHRAVTNVWREQSDGSETLQGAQLQNYKDKEYPHDLYNRYHSLTGLYLFNEVFRIVKE